MAEVDDKSSTYLPPGFRLLTEVVAADGLKTVRDRHAGGEPAFGLSQHTGKMVEIPREVWRTHEALEVLEHGIWYQFHRPRGMYSNRSGPSIEEFIVLIAESPSPRTDTPVALKPPKWWSEVRKQHPQRPDEPAEAYIDRMHDLMLTAKERGEVTHVWPLQTWRRRMYDK